MNNIELSVQWTWMTVDTWCKQFKVLKAGGAFEEDDVGDIISDGFWNADYLLSLIKDGVIEEVSK